VATCETGLVKRVGPEGSRHSFYARSGASIFLNNANCKIVTPDIQSDFNIARMKVRLGWITEITGSVPQLE
jgi:hypothetical protein